LKPAHFGSGRAYRHLLDSLFDRGRAYMKSFSKLQIASGVALLVSVLVALAVYSLNFGFAQRLCSAAVVCAFGFLFLSRDGAPQEDEPWWW